MVKSDTITIVTGLARSGTSLMMQMLRAGGMPLLYDNVREPNEHNPLGFFEYAPVLQPDCSWLDLAVGKAVKVFYTGFLPLDRSYKFVVMRRDLREIGCSLGGQIPIVRLEQELGWLLDWLFVYQLGRYLEVSYRQLIFDPEPCLSRLADFLQPVRLDAAAMRSAIDLGLYRQRIE